MAPHLLRFRVRLARRLWRSKIGPRLPMTHKRLIWGAGVQFFLPWAKDSIWNGRRLYLPTLLGLSALFNQEKAEFPNRSEYQIWSPSCAYSIGHPMFHTKIFFCRLSVIFTHKWAHILMDRVCEGRPQ